MQIIKEVRGVLWSGLAILLVGIMTNILMPSTRAAAAGITVDKQVTTHQSTSSTSVTSPAFTTSQSNELLAAFLSSDGPNSPNSQSFSAVTGGGLTWKLNQRTNAQAGTAEIWTAVAPTTLSNVTVKATHAGSYQSSATVVAFIGADTTTQGAVATKSGSTGASSASLTTTRANSWIWAAGTDWDKAQARTVGTNQIKVDEYLTSNGDTYWVQRQSATAASPGTAVVINTTAPTGDRWDLSLIEILPALPSDTTAPTAPSNLTATALSTNQVSLNWSASTDNVGVSGYKIFRNGTQITTSVNTSFSDNTVLPNSTYDYQVQAYDAAGNSSPNSNSATVITPADTTPPIISSVAASAITNSGAVISWTTNETSDSQVAYGTTTDYGSLTTLNTSLVTSHSQSLSGLDPGTTYHYAVLSKDNAGNLSISSDNTFVTTAPDTQAPIVQLTSPAEGSTVSGQVTLNSTASDNVGVVGVQYLLDGNNLGNETTSAPYSLNWNTSTTNNATHTLAARARDAAGNISTSSVTISVNNPPAGLAPTIDPSTPAARAVANNVRTSTSPTFSPPANTVIYAVFSMDSASYSGTITTVSSVTTSGSPITWHLLGRNNNFNSVAGGFLEVWWAYNPTAQTNITSTATFSINTKNVTPPVGDFQIIVMNNAAPDQSAAAWSANWLISSQNNSPYVNLVTTKANSQVFGVFNNWNNSQTPVPGTNQSIQSIVLNTADVDGYWVQKQNIPTASAGTNVLMNATDPGNANQWRAIAWEVLAN
jgi:hypothetical protein